MRADRRRQGRDGGRRKGGGQRRTPPYLEPEEAVVQRGTVAIQTGLIVRMKGVHTRDLDTVYGAVSSHLECRKSRKILRIQFGLCCVWEVLVQRLTSR